MRHILAARLAPAHPLRLRHHLDARTLQPFHRRHRRPLASHHSCPQILTPTTCISTPTTCSSPDPLRQGPWGACRYARMYCTPLQRRAVAAPYGFVHADARPRLWAVYHGSAGTASRVAIAVCSRWPAVLPVRSPSATARQWMRRRAASVSSGAATTGSSSRLEILWSTSRSLTRVAKCNRGLLCLQHNRGLYEDMKPHSSMY